MKPSPGHGGIVLAALITCACAEPTCDTTYVVRDSTETIREELLPELTSQVATFDAETRYAVCPEVVVWRRRIHVDRRHGITTARIPDSPWLLDDVENRQPVLRSALCELLFEKHLPDEAVDELDADWRKLVLPRQETELNELEKGWLAHCAAGRRSDATALRALDDRCGTDWWSEDFELLHDTLWTADERARQVTFELGEVETLAGPANAARVWQLEPPVVSTEPGPALAWTVDGIPATADVLHLLGQPEIVGAVESTVVLTMRGRTWAQATDGTRRQLGLNNIYGPGIPLRDGLQLRSRGAPWRFDGERFTPMPYGSNETVPYGLGETTEGPKLTASPTWYTTPADRMHWELSEGDDASDIFAVAMPMRDAADGYWSIQQIEDHLVVVRSVPDGAATVGALCGIDGEAHQLHPRGDEVWLTWIDEGVASAAPIRMATP